MSCRPGTRPRALGAPPARARSYPRPPPRPGAATGAPGGCGRSPPGPSPPATARLAPQLARPRWPEAARDRAASARARAYRWDAVGCSRNPPEDEVATGTGGAMTGADDRQLWPSWPPFVAPDIAPVSETPPPPPPA